MELSTDSHILWEGYGLNLNLTLVYSWVVMVILTGGSWLVTRRIVVSGPKPRWQNALEILVIGIRDTIREIWPTDPARFVPFVGTLFLYISGSSILGIVPGFAPPTGSLSTTAALAFCVFLAVPFYGVIYRGIGGYLAGYLKPTPLMLPFHLIGEVSRTVALAVRLFGNMMSGLVLLGVLAIVAPLFFPVLVNALGLLIGQIQAYIFAVLATVYLASAASSHEKLSVSKEERKK
jgi:F-type H+-transporting ATPase subunit a